MKTYYRFRDVAAALGIEGRIQHEVATKLIRHLPRPELLNTRNDYKSWWSREQIIEWAKSRGVAVSDMPGVPRSRVEELSPWARA